MSMVVRDATFSRLTIEQQNKLKLDCMDIPHGGSSYDVACPACGFKSSFSVARVEEGIVYNCFRNTCGVRGFVPSIGSRTLRLPNKREVKPPNNTFPYKGDLEDIPADIAEYLCEKYELVPNDLEVNGWKYSPLTHRILFPMKNYYGFHYGWVAKILPDSKYCGAKSITYMDQDDGIRLSWAIGENVVPSDWDSVIITEDIISATKTSCLYPSAALLGTNLSSKQAAHLATHFDKLIIMLDPDATTKALELSNKYRGMFEACHVVTLDKDPKDTLLEAIEDKLISII